MEQPTWSERLRESKSFYRAEFAEALRKGKDDNDNDNEDDFGKAKDDSDSDADTDFLRSYAPRTVMGVFHDQGE